MTDAALDVIGSLEAHALEYAEQGLEVFPVCPQTKRPMAAVTRGAPSQYGATTDAAAIRGWWQRWPDALIGHRLPENQVTLDIDPRHGGIETWQKLRDVLGMPSPETRIHMSGRNDGGGHITWLRPDGKLTISKIDDFAREHQVGHQVTDANDEPTGHWVSGIDLLHRNHRYTILPPSPHPASGHPYRWQKRTEPKAMPAPLAEMLIDTRPPPPPFEPKPYDGDSPADWYSANHGFADLLPKHGWALRQGTGDSDGSTWQHPNATSPVSATVRHDCLFVYSPNTVFPVTAPDDPNGITRFTAYAELEHGGDMKAAARAAAEMRDGPRKRINLADYPLGVPNYTTDDDDDETTEPPPPVDVYWADDEADPPAPLDELVSNYVARGELTVLGAPRAMGKTWAAMQLAQIVTTGHGKMFGQPALTPKQAATVVYLQGELSRSGSYMRWRIATKGKPPHVAEVFERLKIQVTSTRVSQSIEGITETHERSIALVDHRLEPLLVELGCDLLIVDPWATYYAGSENSNDETEAAIDALTLLLRRVNAAGHIIHHITAKATHGNLAEPEDLWRGASRLADAVATRITLLPHYTAARAREIGLDRFDARRYADIHLMSRNNPPLPVMHAHRPAYEWERWEPPDTPGRPAKLADKDITNALRIHGPVGSKRELASLLEVTPKTLDDHLQRLETNNVITVTKGVRGALSYSLVEGEIPT